MPTQCSLPRVEDMYVSVPGQLEGTAGVGITASSCSAQRSTLTRCTRSSVQCRVAAGRTVSGRGDE